MSRNAGAGACARLAAWRGRLNARVSEGASAPGKRVEQVPAPAHRTEAGSPVTGGADEPQPRAEVWETGARPSCRTRSGGPSPPSKAPARPQGLRSVPVQGARPGLGRFPLRVPGRDVFSRLERSSVPVFVRTSSRLEPLQAAKAGGGDRPQWWEQTEQVAPWVRGHVRRQTPPRGLSGGQKAGPDRGPISVV